MLQRKCFRKIGFDGAYDTMDVSQESQCIVRVTELFGRFCSSAEVGVNYQGRCQRKLLVRGRKYWMDFALSVYV
jgi:hypothetical protein